MEVYLSICVYCNFEIIFFGIFKFGIENCVILLIFMVVLVVISVILKIYYIGLCGFVIKLDYCVYSLLMILGNGLLIYLSIS